MAKKIGDAIALRFGNLAAGKQSVVAIDGRCVPRDIQDSRFSSTTRLMRRVSLADAPREITLADSSCELQLSSSSAIRLAIRQFR